MRILLYSLIFIPVENINIKIVQTFSLFIIFAIPIYVASALIKHVFIEKSKLLLLTFYFYMTFVTIFNMLLRSEVPNNLLRGIVGLLIGILIYFSLWFIFYEFSDEQISRFLMYSYILVIISVIIEKIHHPNLFYRVKALYTEPAHFGNDLVLIYLPVLLIYKNYYKRFYKILICSYITMLLLTMSTTSVIKLLFFFLIMILHKKSPIEKAKTVMLVISFIVFIIMMLNWFPNTYAGTMIQLTYNAMKGKGKFTFSFVDRFSIFFVLREIIANPHLLSRYMHYIIFGGGVGADSNIILFFPRNLFIEFYPSFIAKKTLISSFFGKLFIYGGILGTVLYYLYIVNIFHCLRVFKNHEKTILYSALSTLVFSQMFSVAPFQTISLWFIPAFISSKFTKRKAMMKKAIIQSKENL